MYACTKRKTKCTRKTKNMREERATVFFFLGVYKCYVHYIFSTLSKQIINERLLVVVISRQKSNFSGEFKLEPITTYPLRICCENVMNV